MKGSKRLELVIELAQRKRQEADQMLLESRSRLEQAEQGLLQLEKFLDEYIDSTRLQPGKTVSSLDLQMPSAFVGRLGGSIRQQKQVVEEFRRQHTEVETWWRKLYAREKAMIKLQSNLHQRELIADEKQLQKQIDELWQNRPTSPM